MRFHNLILLTTETLKEPLEDDLLLARALEANGLRVSLENWERFEPESQRMQAVLFRTTWGYPKKLKAFKNLLKSLSKSGLDVWNSPNQIRWNLKKDYLLKLEGLGYPVIPSKLLRREELRNISDILSKLEYESFVIKPLVGSSALGCHRLELGDSLELLTQELQNSNCDHWLLQEFQETLITEGELSLVFFENEFSHAALKRPGQDDYRVQEELGGKVEITPCPSEALRVAKKILNGLEEEPLYARVDLVRKNKGYLLMELELIEPDLFLRLHKPSVAQFSSSLLKRF
ncbi:MAG: hypothetical protein EA369_07580 [Bradymonadales bacterium]|nr:MAG: hypothetical protein EA369_07580 [Bradymonadales bacterium]